MYEKLPSFVLGFHGCDGAVAERVFAGKTALTASKNDYDWLGHGVYFWENNPSRALNFANLLKQNPDRAKTKIKQPAVIGAVIDLGLCLNLLDSHFIRMMKDGYQALKTTHERAGLELPVNRRVGSARDLLLRHLDCAVIETLHVLGKEQGLAPFDSARGVFVEGDMIYPGAGVNEFNHIQICVRNPRCIKGYFRVID